MIPYSFVGDTFAGFVCCFMNCYSTSLFFAFAPVPPSRTPSLLRTLKMVPKKQRRSIMKLIFWAYSPSSFAFSSISSSSRPLICAQPVRPAGTSLAPYLSRSAMRSY